MEDLRALATGICDAQEKQKCRIEFGDNLGWACENCRKNKAAEIGEYTLKLFRIRALRMAGYPFEANDFTYDEWEDLGKVEQWLQTQEPSAWR